MKGIVEQYARGEFKVDRPVVAISVSRLELNICLLYTSDAADE